MKSVTEDKQKEYKLLKKGAVAEIVEKKSRFIASISPAATEEEASAFIASVKKRYWDARHNCSAFVIGAGGELTRCSDDGEPSGTAGKPMLEVLLGSGIRNICVVVTRYFGGVLLGTGGLVRAYSGAVSNALSECAVVKMIPGREIAVTCDYSYLEKIRNILGNADIADPEAEYTENVSLRFFAPEDKYEDVLKKITDATGGGAGYDISDPGYGEVPDRA